MPFKTDYLTLAGVNAGTYTSWQTAVFQIQGLYITARRGRLSTSIGAQLWTQFFSPLRVQLGTLPCSQQPYDSFAISQILALAGLLRQHQRGDFGIAQKMFNLFIKDHWALGALPPQSEAFLHLPLDSGIVHKLSHLPSSWSAWTKVVVTPTTQQQIVNDYLQIQATYRNYWQRVNATVQRFNSPLEMEQLLWQPI